MKPFYFFLIWVGICFSQPVLAQTNSPAWRAAGQFLRGVNLANDLEVPPGQNWAVAHSVVDLREIRAEGFDHVRIPVGWHHYTGPAPEYLIGGNIFARADELVTNALALGLNVIINLHHFNEFTADPGANTACFRAIWRQVAAHYAQYPSALAFELLNEPNDAATTAVMNSVYAETLPDVRLTNPNRVIFLGPGNWNSPNELKNFHLPHNDNNIIVTLHCYAPMFFTHQGATWAGPDVPVTGIQFPGPPLKPLSTNINPTPKKWVIERIQHYNVLPESKNPSSPVAFLPLLMEAKKWSDQNSVPIHFGEFGAYTKADQASRARYYSAMRRAVEAEGFGWAIWDWKSGFNYWNAKLNKPLPGMHQALFSPAPAATVP